MKVSQEDTAEIPVTTDRRWSKFGATKHDIYLLKMAALLLGYFTFAWIPMLIYVSVGILCPECYIDDYIR